jgi:hypothetical protein
MTKSSYTGMGSVGQPCAGSVDYQGRKGSCRRNGRHPDPDGVRWWCGIHDPKKVAEKAAAKAAKVEVVKTVTSAAVTPKAGSDKKPRPKAVMQPISGAKLVDAEVLVSASQAQVADVRAIEAMEEVRVTLIEISNTNTVGWDATVPVANYNIIITHMADRAREAQVKLAEVLKQLKA